MSDTDTDGKISLVMGNFDATGYDIHTMSNWRREIVPAMKRNGEKGWLIVPGSVHVSSIQHDRTEEYGPVGLDEYITLQMYRKKPDNNVQSED
jgi:hypothetical protein